MKKIIQIVLIFGFVFLINYAIEQYQMKKVVDTLSELTIVAPERLNKLSITEYPELLSYQSFDYDEVQETVRALNKLELAEAKRVKESESYTKIRFSEDGAQKYIEYYFYENGSVYYVEDGLAAARSNAFKLDEEVLQEIVASLKAGKVFD